MVYKKNINAELLHAKLMNEMLYYSIKATYSSLKKRIRTWYVETGDM